MQQYNKAIAAIVGGLIALLVTKGVLPAEWQDPVTVTTIAGLVSALLVWVVPNKPSPKHGGGGGP